jgi:UDP:flavonoid glycosyltransferase YjiC (YdhE family)
VYPRNPTSRLSSPEIPTGRTVVYRAAVRALVITWAPGGNLPPMVAAAQLLAARGHDVEVMGSGATRAVFEAGGFAVHPYRRAPEPVTRIAFEAQAESMLGIGAGAEIALDVRDLVADEHCDLAVVDCMLPAAVSAVRASGVPAAQLVHFLYGPVRQQLLAGQAWTTDLATLAATHRQLGLAPALDALAAWESAELLLVPAPRWFDLGLDYPANVVHAGPLGVRTSARRRRTRVLLSFSTTVMHDQRQMVQRVCDAVAATGLDAVLTLGPALDAGPPQVAGNIQVLSFADHDDLLPGCSAVVTHGGLGTTLRALAHGVPLLLLPLGRDQGFNAERATRLGVATQISATATPPEIRAALQSLLDDARIASTAARTAQRMVAAAPDRVATEAFERIALTRDG